jgi:hypothetical protein
MVLSTFLSFFAIVAVSFEMTWTAAVVGAVAVALITHGL